MLRQRSDAPVNRCCYYRRRCRYRLITAASRHAAESVNAHSRYRYST